MIITHYGRYWNRQLTDWAAVKATRRLPCKGDVDAFSFCGIYLLHDSALQPVYVGQVRSIERGLGTRLLEHCSDHLWGDWHYYSWFAIKAWNQAEAGDVDALINEFEHLFIYLLAPRLNRKQGTAEGAVEVLQAFRNGEGLFTPFPIYSELERLTQRISQIEQRLPSTNQPNKAPEPTTTSVTSPAAQEPRQP